MQDALLQKLRDLSHADIPVTEESELLKDLGFDSLGIAQLQTLLEEEYGIPAPEPDDLRTAGDVLKLVESGKGAPVLETTGWHERLLQPPAMGLDDLFHPEWTFTDRFLTAGARGILRAWFAFWHRLEVHGMERLPAKGPYLICPNHQSYPDPMFLYAHLPRHLLEQLLFIAWEGYFRRPPYIWLNKIGRVLPTGGRSRMPECLKLAYDGLKRGKIVCIFPEGGRTTTGKLTKPRLGAGILGQETGVPIYPVRIDGALGALSFLRKGMHFCKITVTVLDPIHPEKKEGGGTMDDYRALMDRWSLSFHAS